MPAARLPLFFLAAVALGVGWLGCATSNGDPDEPGGNNSEATGNGTSKPAPTERPAFEAGFEEDPNVDPTPDGGDTCVDNDDPGSSEVTAKVLPPTDDAQNVPITVNGVMNGAVDVDFYKLSMTDLSFRTIDDAFEIKTSGVEMCVFVKCKQGATTVSTCAGGVKKTSSIGMEGCCATGPSQASPKWDCPGLTDDDSADFYIRISQTGTACVPYSFSYVF
ncbi:MAG: hypothetical protein KF819_25465 [Labilithrix sp.]|nr:hypothetical protein [Labilithrix sp.]